MADVDDSIRSRYQTRELPYDKEQRLRRRGRAPALVVLALIVALAAFAYWLRHR